jgi:hypothetical protein
MNIRNIFGAMAMTTFVITAHAQMPRMRMTTDIPEGIETPNRLETHLGTLTSFDGVPDQATTEKLYDDMDLRRATEAFLATLPVASMSAMEAGLRKFGPPNTTALLFENLMDSKSLWLTPNTVSIYQAMWVELGDEPMVIETPPAVLGIIDDAWFQYVTDFGNAGPDRGQGGKFLLVPPGYIGELPEGYYVARSNTYGNWVVWRGFQVDGSTRPALEATKSRFRVYPLSQAGNPPPTINFINVSGTEHNTIHRMDYGYWNEVNETIQAEPTNGLDPEVRGMLASIGIEKGKPFNPDARMRGILTEAAKVGSVTAQALAARPRGEEFYVYPGQRVWTNPLPGGHYDFLENGARMLDARADMHFYATGITPAMAARNVGVGSQYLIAYLDKDDNALDGSKTYKIHLPPNVPAVDFWSFTLYDNQTRSMLQTDQQFPGVDSLGDVQANADGSYDIYFGPQAPRGMDNNWIQTVPGKAWNTIFRLYGPLEPFYDQTWMPGDPELVD